MLPHRMPLWRTSAACGGAASVASRRGSINRPRSGPPAIHPQSRRAVRLQPRLALAHHMVVAGAKYGSMMKPSAFITGLVMRVYQ